MNHLSILLLRCSQSEAYERVDEDNGIYMKHLKNHICRNEKIEDIFHAVTTGIESELFLLVVAIPTLEKNILNMVVYYR